MRPRLILDNSVSAAWCFADESNSYTESVFQAVAHNGGAVAPALWPLELANALVVAERRKRITAEHRQAFLASIGELDIAVQSHATDHVFHQAIELATKYRLSVYAAVYLELAIRQRLPLATQDEELIRAAREAGVSIFQP